MGTLISVTIVAVLVGLALAFIIFGIGASVAVVLDVIQRMRERKRIIQEIKQREKVDRVLRECNEQFEIGRRRHDRV